jgi:hypothetical protein
MPDAIVAADPSTATQETAVETPIVEAPLSDRLSKLTPEQRTNWKLTGEFPSADTSKDADPEHAPESDPDKVGQDPSKPRKPITQATMNREIGRLTAEKRQLERDSAARDAEIARLRQQLNKPAPETTNPANTTADGRPIRPKASEFSGEDAIEKWEAALDIYEEKLADWKYDQKHTQREARTREEQKAAEQNKRNETIESQWAEREKAARAKYPDYQEKVWDTKWPICTDAMRAYLAESESNAELAYYLGSHHDEIMKIAALSPVRQVAALTKIEAGFETAAPVIDHKRTLQNAPKPPADVGGRSGPVKDPLEAAREGAQRGDPGATRRMIDLANERDIARMKQGR